MFFLSSSSRIRELGSCYDIKLHQSPLHNNIHLLHPRNESICGSFPSNVKLMWGEEVFRKVTPHSVAPQITVTGNAANSHRSGKQYLSRQRSRCKAEYKIILTYSFWNCHSVQGRGVAFQPKFRFTTNIYPQQRSLSLNCLRWLSSLLSPFHILNGMVFNIFPTGQPYTESHDCC